MEFAAHQPNFASKIEDLILNCFHNQHRRCADEAASIWYRMDYSPPFSASPNVYEDVSVPAEPIESSKVLKVSEFNATEVVNMCIHPSLPIQENNDGGSVLSDDWRRCCEIIKGISMALACLHEERKHDNRHGDLKPANILLDENMTAKITDFGMSRHLVEEEQTRTKKSCIEKLGHTDLEHTGRNVISKNSASYFSLGFLIVLSMMQQLTGTAHKHWRSTLQAREMWILDSSSKQIKRLNQIVLSCLETGKSRKATGSTVSSIQRVAYDVQILWFGALIGAMVHVASLETLLGSYTAPNMDSMVLVLGLVSAMAAALSMDQHLFRSNHTEERSDKPRSNIAPATNSSDKTTHSTPMANKLTNNEVKNHNDPNSSVAERDRPAEANKRPAGEWHIATAAAHHATGNPDLITNLLVLESDALRVHVADGTPMPVCGRGNVVTEDIVLPDVYYVPGLQANLVSVGQLAGMDYCFSFGRGACVVSDAAGTVIGRAHARGDGLYVADFLRVPLNGTP